jgi:[acyl-carrier-protein] S-malonyltransferase
MKTALLFPGQGAQARSMCDGVRRSSEFAARYRTVKAIGGIDILERLDGGDLAPLEQNLCTALLTVLVSALSFDHLLLERAEAPAAVAGYSVGQWSAMYAARMLSFESLVTIVVARARLMDACSSGEPGAMCAVLGVRPDALEALLQTLRAEGLPVYLSNDNCLGQYSIAGSERAVAAAEARLKALQPKKLVRLAIRGAWHCPLLTEAATRFREQLETLPLAPPELPVIDNVSGGWLPSDPTALRDNLARHLSHAVRWQSGMATLKQTGCNRFIEVGFGRQLSKFGFFLDRHAEFSGYAYGDSSCAA